MLSWWNIARGLLLMGLLLVGVFGPQPTRAEEAANKDSARVTSKNSHAPRELGKPSPLPLPSTMSTLEYEKLLFPFLQNAEYKKLGWLKDKGVRDTGPYIDKKSYGTHPSVRIYYSPGVIRWLMNDRQGDIPDGEMIVKEHYQEPALRHHDKDEAELFRSVLSWTIMVKDAEGSYDGWFWSNPGRYSQPAENHSFPFNHAASGFGHYCIRCHASTKSPGPKNEYTFSSLRNIEGFPGAPLLFRVDDSWRDIEDEYRHPPEDVTDDEKSDEKSDEVDGAEDGDSGRDAGKKIAMTSPRIEGSHPSCTNQSSPFRCIPKRNDAFIATYGDLSPRERSEIEPFPNVTHDWALMDRDASQGFITSNQCMSCHAGLVGSLGTAMFVGTHAETGLSKADYPGKGWHVSPYGEWRWTPMGLAGRDPVFHAQMGLELAVIRRKYGDDPDKVEKLSAELQQTCLSCHGVMGKHQFTADHGDSGETYRMEHVFEKTPEGVQLGGQKSGLAKYGALSRDGVSCVVCHRAQPREKPADFGRSYLEHFLATSITGNLHFGKQGEIYGPYKDDELAPYAMEHALGIKPKYSEYIKSSQMCGTCHTVNLPILNRPFVEGEKPAELVEAEPNPLYKQFHHHVEQATYLEWLNSEYENDLTPDNPRARTCQDCHMSKVLRDPETGIDMAVETRIAAIQDATYPDAENLASHDDLHVRVRKEFSRHNFVGLNIFLVEMFRQFDDVLGVRKHDFMTGSENDLRNSQANFLQVAKEQTADVEVKAVVKEGTFVADVLVSNKTGHRFPSGVGFRRAFLEFTLHEKQDEESPRLIWASGRTNRVGVIVGANGKPLPTEFFADGPQSQQYQRHHEVISSPNQVQIYETLLQDHVTEEFTTSFVHGCDTIKDNRLLPRGWKKNPHPDLKGFFLKSTMPGPDAMRDQRFVDGSGSDVTRYQFKLPENVDPSRLVAKATLYYQAMPPYFLKAIFDEAPEAESTKRLHHLIGNMDLEHSPIEGWKLEVNSATCTIP